MKTVNNFLTPFLSLLLCVLVFAPVFAQDCAADIKATDKTILRQILEKCQNEIKQQEKLLSQQQFEITNTQRDIQVIDVAIKRALAGIRSSDLILGDLNSSIVSKKDAIDEFRSQIKDRSRTLSSLLQKLNESEQRSILTILLSNASLSSFFVTEDTYNELRKSVESSIEELSGLEQRVSVGIQDLNVQKTEEAQLRAQKRAAANQVNYQRQQKDEILNIQKQIERKIEDDISARRIRVAEIQNRLFEFSGGGAIPFKEALKIAEYANTLTGIRPAFLLGLIKHESDLGKNVGKGSWRIDMHPTRDKPIFPFIANLLGLSPDDVRVSANPGFGWGGAMGPAQFIPSTWVCYAGLINEKTNTCYKSNSLIRSTDLLKEGSRGADVRRLQVFLNKHGFAVSTSGPGSRGSETDVFGSNVKKAVNRFQLEYANRILKPNGLSRPTGQVGPSTRAAINELNFYSGPWKYDSKRDKIRNLTGDVIPSNPWKPRDAFLASATYLKELGANTDECKAARRYYAGGNWRINVALRYCQSVLSNAKLFQNDINFLKG